ncbi:hypothetical protein [Aquabacterium humicola]|uniref:hypothetical protein n=1 Tax=Aquabacterium humicola TaxID=3237377 RepID=UPI00254315A1|nr:hypothetical protein [Rubrivivax pictus]
MAALHLELEIDSEVYPELHAMLCALGSDASRGERLRQLAASGLVWEYVRLRAPVAAVQRASATPAPWAGAGVAAATRPPPPRAPTADFVDLAIDAMPPAAPADARPAEARASEPPLLVDVVQDEGPGAMAASAVPMADGVPPDEASTTRARLLRMRDRGLFRNG